MIKTLLIANRGEIACRIIRTAHAMGLRAVAVYSTADRHALHVRTADEAVCIGPADAARSYLNADAILAAAKQTRADAIHPGYGFLAENAGFATAVADAGLIFVGPPPSAIEAMGAKDAAKRLMEAAKVPVVPGYHGVAQSADHLKDEAEKIGYPVLIKATFGGGGKGMRRVEAADEFGPALGSAKREAASAFGNDSVIIERCINAPRHIEVQIFADTHGNIVHLYERDCSLQRRHQKVIEEAPAPGMTEGLRARMTAAAIAAAKAVGYAGAGTVEFIVGGEEPLGDTTAFYFMEMNTRLQVEHPVTEMITGLDLVEWQLRVAAGEVLPAEQAEISVFGHASEARLYAENPVTGFLPATGRILHMRYDAGGQMRVDTGVAEGGDVTSHYDPMIAKVITHGPTRAAAITRLDAALSGFEFAGPETNQAFLRLLLADEDFLAGRMNTNLIDRKLPMLIKALETLPDDLAVAAAEAAISAATGSNKETNGGAEQLQGPWGAVDAFQIGPARSQSADILIDGARRTVMVTWAEGVPVVDAGSPVGTGAATVLTVNDHASGIIAMHEGRQVRACLVDPFTFASEHQDKDGDLRAPMPGLVTGIEVANGQGVTLGEQLMVLEAMKMEHNIKAPFDGTVTRIDVVVGDRVSQGDALIHVETSALDEAEA